MESGRGDKGRNIERRSRKLTARLPLVWAACLATILLRAAHGQEAVSETVVVEASSWLEDNAWILDLASAEHSIVGFVGHLLPHAVDFPKHLQRFAAHPIFPAGQFPLFVPEAMLRSPPRMS